MRQQALRCTLLLFLLWHFTGTILWLWPEGSLRNHLLQPFVSYLNFFGFWQGWSVFETPKTANVDLKAIVKFRDGSEKEWIFPRMELLDIIERMHKERYRQWKDYVNGDSNGFIRSDAAIYIARRFNNVQNPPVMVTIVRHWTLIPPPGNRTEKRRSQTEDGQSVLCVIPIRAEELQ